MVLRVQPDRRPRPACDAEPASKLFSGDFPKVCLSRVRSATSRFKRELSYRARHPVICVGNFTAGGGGKTPTALAVALLLKAMGKRPAFLTRGYGGSAKGVVRVDGQDAAEVGDDRRMRIVRVRTAQFLGTYQGFHTRWPGSSELKRRFYYPEESR